MQCLFFMTCLVQGISFALSLFAGDGCFAGEVSGRCRLLSDCDSLLSEIKRAGAPMPARLRMKLQSLTCGFKYEEPLVCCVPQITSNENYTPNLHGLGVVSDRPEPERERDPWTTNDKTQLYPQDDGINKNGNQQDTSEDPPDVSRHRNLRLLPTDCGQIESDRIWGGNRTHLFEMPWMVLIAYESGRGTKLSCGGTLITERYVLTAAHCVSFLGNRLRLSGILLGEYDVRKDPDCERVEGVLNCAPNMRNVTIEKVIPHPGYSPQNLFDDIALVRLSEPADFSLDNMKPICLPITSELQTESLIGQNALVAGWGATEDGLQSPVLLYVELPIVSNEDCQAVYNGNPHIYDRQLCAGGVQDKDSCGGDSGGPLLYPGRVGASGTRYVQRGIVSYGSKRCGIGGFPGVYTRVGHYMDWILDNIDD